MGKRLEKTRFCKLSAQNLDDDAKAFVELVSTPKFVCLKCYRVSANKDNLCKPAKLKKLVKE